MSHKYSSFVKDVTPITKLSSLASLLDMNEQDLIELSQETENYRINGKKIKKKNGDIRVTHDAKPRLKNIHEKIKVRILKKAHYPKYLLAGIHDPDSPRHTKAHAQIHSGKKQIINEDIANFYPSCSKDIIIKIWKFIFCFSDEVAEVLANLTTYKSALPQGWKTSGYLANLVLFGKEEDLVQWLSTRGYAYSRYMDDITISSERILTNNNKSEIISKVYGMLASRNLKPNRGKHEIKKQGGEMTVTNLCVNNKNPAIPSSERKKIRSIVFQLEETSSEYKNTIEFRDRWRSARGKVATLQSFHKKEGKKLAGRLSEIKPHKDLMKSKIKSNFKKT